ncbi:translocation/assembly module TamB domain-containing protein [Acinetobacter sp. C26M]|uniref:translocation/assembly module TamB domain-containing protein n=1 Tax=unclassified Acinetobacter TaxID=196816 RepID=UPI0020368086|nr:MULTISPECIES: translocation/assembly module TamB domain-containing protein [unclassified Acinetobacter]USA47968.1 translocation/assembly module TamB domain-containing protein [Acinetobacter sp. C26M]USA51448.1 translocation/assembly module TamB domain-containing protein [Acinetobacter sp. C26G]
MTEVEQQLTPPTEPRQQRRILRNILLIVLIILLLLISSLAVMMSTDKGSRFLLDRVLQSQKTIKYEYESGNLISGIILKNVLVRLEGIDVSLDRADVSLGWRAILKKEVHLSHADVRNLKILDKKPPSGKPFGFDPIKLPFVLRVDEASLDHLELQTTTSKVDFSDIYLKDALWSETKLKFKDSRMKMEFLAVNKATGEMDFSGKYPLNATADLIIPSLKSLDIDVIKVAARGSLDTLKVGIATRTPDLLTAWAVVHPVRDHVPMNGELFFKNYHLPLLKDQKLFAKDGVAKFNGDIQKLALSLNTDLKGEQVPEGQYTALMDTDLTHQLNIREFNGQLMGGAVSLLGFVNWHDHVSWDVKGRLDRLDLKDKTVPQIAQDFLPPNLDASLSSTGSMEKGLVLNAQLAFDKFETWAVKLNQAEEKDNKAQPMLLDVSWKGIDRAMPYIGWLSSEEGHTNLTLKEGQQDIYLTTTIRPHEQALLPTGKYDARLDVKGDLLDVENFRYEAEKGSLSGQAKVKLPTEKQQLSWQAQLKAQNFNPQTVTAAAPINLLNGEIKATGFAKPNQQIIQLEQIDLTGQLPQENKTETIALKGKSTAALIFHDEKAGGGFKSFAVDYNGSLNALNQGNGVLKIKVAGTPDYIKINELNHDGVAGKIYATGAVNLKDKLGWDIDASLVRFKPQYFVSSVKGEVSGRVKTLGVWSDKLKRIDIRELNAAGFINNKPIRGRGNLSLLLDSNQEGFLPQQFEANDLFLAYAQNQLQATGNAQNLAIKLNAPALYELYPGLRGRAYGSLNVQSKPRLKATANMVVDNFAFNDLVTIRSLKVQGELPTSETTPTQLTATLDQLRNGNREIEHATLNLAGTRKAHLLKIESKNRQSNFYVQLAGGFNPKNDWLGLIQKGSFKSHNINLVQNQNAPIIYTTAQQELYVGQHCWQSANSQLCLDQAARISKEKGSFSFITKNLDLKDFTAFMPEGLAVTGQLNGYAKASWAQGSHPKLDARLVTRKGEIGLAADDPQDPATTVTYDELSVIAKSISEGLLLRVDMKTPDIGTGYANVIINPYQANMPMRGEVAFDDVQLKVFKPFIKDVRSMSGTLALAGKMNGTLTQPEFVGEMRLKNGAISMISLPVNLSNIQLYSSIRQQSASIDGAFNSGQGVGRLKGNFDWKNDPHLNLTLKGDNLLVRQAPMITAIVEPDLTLDVYPFNQRLSLKGTIDIPRARISMPESSATVVNLSPDVRVVQQGQDLLATLKAAKPWDIRADMTVTLGNQVIFQGFESTIPLVGRLHLSQRGLETAMRANGAIGVSQKVKIEAYGQSLDLNRAIARFNGPLANPTLDIDANKPVQGSMVGVRVTGTATVPNIQIYNDAGLSEQEALNALLTGRINEGNSGLSNTEGFKSDVNNTIAAAGISMGLGGTRALTNQIGRTFGLSGLALDAQGTGDDTQVSLTGYITPDLFIRYGIGVFTPVNKLTLRYQMNRRLYLEASQSLERAIDVFYNWRF